jgi:hypothetical protein
LTGPSSGGGESLNFGGYENRGHVLVRVPVLNGLSGMSYNGIP